MLHFSFYTFAWIAALLYGLETIVGKLTAKHAIIANPWLFNFLWNFVIVILTVPVALYFGASLPSHWGNILAVSVFYTLAGIFFVLALYKLDVSVLTPLYSVKTGLTVLLGAIFLGEILSGFQYFLIAIILLFSPLVSLNEKWSIKSFLNLGIAFAMADMVVLALEAVFIKKAIAEIGFWNTALWSAALGQIFLMFTLPWLKKDLPKVKPAQFMPLVIMGLAAVLATLSVNKAYAENVSISTAITSLPLSMVLVFILSFFAPKLLEKHLLKVYAVRFISAGVMILAAIKLG